MLYNTEDDVFVKLDSSTLDLMKNEAASWCEVETGGLLFGNIEETSSNNIYIHIHKTVIPDDEYCKREQFFFEIDPVFSKGIIKDEKLDYLGNWHCHLGYGGPSAGDRQQIPTFFEENKHRDYIITFILNRLSNTDVDEVEDYEAIIEVYKRISDHDNPENIDFKTIKVHQENITNLDLQKEEGLPLEKLNLIKTILIDNFENLTTVNDIESFEGSTPNEKIVSFPYSFEIKENEKVVDSIELLIIISFPPEYPDGDIYIDISSKDRSRNFTFDIRSADVLDDDDLARVTIQSLKLDLSEKIPVLLKQPLWKIMDQ